MKISQYLKEYTAGKPITFWNVIVEIGELLFEVLKLSRSGIKDEAGDVYVFLQSWLYCRFGIDGELWEKGMKSYKKFMDRRPVWIKIYNYVGLAADISKYVGNYNRAEKVIRHLGHFGITKERAREAYIKIVLGK